MFSNLFSHHVWVCLIIEMLFLCLNFISLAAISLCVAYRVLLLCFVPFLVMMDLSILPTNARVCSFNENTALVCAYCWASDGQALAHIFLDCCPTGFASYCQSCAIFNFSLLFKKNCPSTYTVFFPSQCCILMYISTWQQLYSLHLGSNTSRIG